jgi:hypothetical protein
MNLGVIREFDFYPFTLKIPKTWKKIYISFSQIDPLLRAGKLDATPYIFPSINFLPSGYKITNLGVILTESSKSLVLVSKKEIRELESLTLGIIQGYEQVLHCVEDTLDQLLKGKAFKIRVFTDIFDADALLIYGDRALRGDFGEYSFLYNLTKGETKIAVWVVREELEDDILPHLGNSIAHWFMDIEKFVSDYATRKSLNFEILLEHAKSLKFNYGG